MIDGRHARIYEWVDELVAAEIEARMRTSGNESGSAPDCPTGPGCEFCCRLHSLRVEYDLWS